MYSAIRCGCAVCWFVLVLRANRRVWRCRAARVHCQATYSTAQRVGLSQVMDGIGMAIRSPAIRIVPNRVFLPLCSASVGNPQGPLPKGVPDIVLHALSTYCKSGLGDSLIYTDLARALINWQSS